MQGEKQSDRLVCFVDYLKSRHADGGSELKVLDLRVMCRSERLTEISDWATSELDLIEQEAVTYGDDTSLDQLMSGAAVQSAAIHVDAWLQSPSPYAWT